MSIGINGFGNSYNIYAQTDLQKELLMSPLEKEQEEEKKARMGIEDPLKTDKKKGDPGYECETCKNRRYQDGSNEMVSFKSAQHVSPTAAASAVRAHEAEHVSNAYSKAEQNNAKVVRASVQIHTSVCPECGRSYVSGGTTSTQIKYYNESNPYQKDLKNQDAAKYTGMNVDAAC